MKHTLERQRCLPRRLPSNRSGLPSRLLERGFTLVELLVVIAIISLIAGFLIPTLLRGRVEANKAKCQSNLKQIATSAMAYSDASGTRFFPFGKGSQPKAHESLNIMVELFSELKPELFICPEWRGGEAQKDEKGTYTLTDDSCAYSWPKIKLNPTDSGFALSSDKFIKNKDANQLNGHEKGMNVVYAGDMSVKFILEKDLDGEDGLPKGLGR